LPDAKVSPANSTPCAKLPRPSDVEFGP
jgi:hypothetical protein